MSKKLRVRKLVLQKLPYGKFKWIGLIKDSKYGNENGLVIQPMRELLETNSMGAWRFDWYKNYRNNRVYTKVYLVEKMDVALIKMCYAEVLSKIYQIEVNLTPDEQE